MTEQRKTASPPIVANIPQELRNRPQWIVWRYEWRTDKWTKVPYVPHTASTKARSNAASTWRSFQSAYSCYLERPDYFDGIGYMFAKNDPYVGGDRDHSLDTCGIPHTYAEISPSGEGIKFIARASGHYGRKTAKGELYSSGRFFTITGNVIPGYTAITECQEQVDTFFASLGSSTRTIRPGTPGNGSRAAHAAAVSEDDWKEGRRLLREDLNRLVARLRASAAPKTQLWYVLKDDFHGLQTQYPEAGALRSDGSIDASQIRAIFASGMRMRRYTFPEFVALFYHFYGAECLAKWGTTKGFREEAATLWAMARTPRTAEAQPKAIEPAPRGRAGSRAELLERTYQVLLNYRAGISAIITLDDVARDLGVHKDTASRAIKELKGKRINTRRHGAYGGLVVDFLPELIANTEDALSNEGNDTNQGAKGGQNEELIYKNETARHVAEKTNHSIANEKTTELIYEEQEAALEQENMPDEDREEKTPYIDRSIYISNTVYLQQPTINSLEQAVLAAFEHLDRQQPDEATGELRKWLITDRRIVEYVQLHYAEFGWKLAAIRYWAGRIRKKRKAHEFDELKKQKRETLEKKAASLVRQQAKLETRAATDPMQDIRQWAAKEARQLNGRIARIAWELKRRDAADAERIESEGYSAGEQQEMLDLVERERRDTGVPSKRVSLQPTHSPVPALVERLKALKHGS